MNFSGNLIWIIFGGLLAAICYVIGGLALCVTIIGIPWGVQCFKIAGFVLAPFGLKAVSGDSAAGCFSVPANIIWLLCGGLYAALIHVVMGILLSITIIGLPWGRQHFKLVEITMLPFGKRIVAA